VWKGGKHLFLRHIAILVLAGHGIGHIWASLASFTSIKTGFKDNPWMFSDIVTIDSTTGHVFGILAIIVVVLFVGSALGVLMEKNWWRQLAIVGSVISLAIIIPFWNSVIVGMLAGAALDVAIILTLMLPWGEKLTEYFGVP
jgi:ABC-type Fe3+ transport system permease subunit